MERMITKGIPPSIAKKKAIGMWRKLHK